MMEAVGFIGTHDKNVIMGVKMESIKTLAYCTLIVLVLSIVFGNVAEATQFFYFDAENGVIGEELPHHQTNGVNFCGPECSGSG